ncbi:amino acid racemase [Patescibacteria group bacterium]|jgi:aspartate racemase|nr:amino acid racemase [Patescibacteria group bacterium]
MSRDPIGILGGMGPGAGVHFKQLIIERTPARLDQEHIPTVLYTNPSIPDRTTAILEGRQHEFVESVCESLRRLEAFGVTKIFIPCNTSFIGYEAFCKVLTVPLYHLPQETLNYLSGANCHETFLMATRGTYAAHVYRSGDGILVEYPSKEDQELVHQLIMAVKAKDTLRQEQLLPRVVRLISSGAESAVLGCTELSMLIESFRQFRPDIRFVDPLEIAADHVIELYQPTSR